MVHLTSAMLGMLLLAGCGASELKAGLGPNDTAPADISVTAEPAIALVGEKVSVRARVRTAGGEPVPEPVDWSASGGALLPVADSEAQFTATAPGTYFVRASLATIPSLQDSTAITVTSPISPTIRISISPDSAIIPTGGTLQYSVIALREDGSTYTPVITWASTGGTVTSDGLYWAGNTPGTFKVIVNQVSGGMADTSIVQIAFPEGVLPWLNEDFSGFATTADLQAAQWLSASDYTKWGTASGMSLDTTEGYGGSTRSMKASWAPGDPGWGVQLDLPSSMATENWTEVWAKFSPSWTSQGGSGPNPDYKFLFWLLTPASSMARNEIKIGEYGTLNRVSTRYEGGPDTVFIFAASNLNDNTWHRYRIHNRITPGSNNAVFNVEFWDGVHPPQLKRQEHLHLPASYTRLSAIYLGANRNRPAATAMWLKWGQIVVYDQDPGWGF